MAQPNKKQTMIGSNLYPEHRGPFLFKPEFLPTEAWYPTFAALIQRIANAQGANVKIDRPYDGRQIRVVIADFDIVIDGDGGIFQVTLTSERDVDDDFMSAAWGGPFGAPRQFFRQMQQAKTRSMLGAHYLTIRDLLEQLDGVMRQRFKAAIERGHARLTAHIGSPFSEPQVLTLGQMNYLNKVCEERDAYLIDDRELDEAVSQVDGTRLFELGVETVDPLLGSQSSKILPSSAVANSASVKKQDSRFREDKDRIIAIIREEYATRKLQPKFNATQLTKLVEDRLSGLDEPPSAGTIRNYIIGMDIF